MSGHHVIVSKSTGAILRRHRFHFQAERSLRELRHKSIVPVALVRK